MQIIEPTSTREDTDILLKIIDSTYAKADLKQVADNATQLNVEERTQLLRLLKYFEEPFLWYSRRLGHIACRPGAKNGF